MHLPCNDCIVLGILHNTISFISQTGSCDKPGSTSVCGTGCHVPAITISTPMLKINEAQDRLTDGNLS